jgi:hypothetical protein
MKEKLIPCKHCPGQAEDTVHKCDGEFGSGGCGEWLYGWFCEDEEDVKCDSCYYKCYHKAGTPQNVAEGRDDPYDYYFCAKSYWTSEPIDDYSNCVDYLIERES